MAATTLALAASASGAGAATITLSIAAAGWTDIADLFDWAWFATDFEAVVTLALGVSPSIASVGFFNEVDVSGFLASCQIKDNGRDRPANLGAKSSFRKSWAGARPLS